VTKVQKRVHVSRVTYDAIRFQFQVYGWRKNSKMPLSVIAVSETMSYFEKASFRTSRARSGIQEGATSVFVLDPGSRPASLNFAGMTNGDTVSKAGIQENEHG